MWIADKPRLIASQGDALDPKPWIGQQSLHVFTDGPLVRPREVTRIAGAPDTTGMHASTHKDAKMHAFVATPRGVLKT